MIELAATAAIEDLIYLGLWIVFYPIAWILSTPFILVSAFFQAAHESSDWRKIARSYSTATDTVRDAFNR